MSLLTRDTFIILRREQKPPKDGHWVKGDLTTIENLKGNIQPLSGYEVLQMPEGDRTKRIRKLFSPDARILPDDIIVFEDFKYEVQSLSDWKGENLTHVSCKLVALENQDEEI